jgi:hypothetical protein
VASVKIGGFGFGWCPVCRTRVVLQSSVLTSTENFLSRRGKKSNPVVGRCSICNNASLKRKPGKPKSVETE